MNEKNMRLAEGLVKASYVRQGEQALHKRERLVTVLLSNRKLPRRGWDEGQIEHLLADLAMMDSNNFVDNVGAGEREARIFSPLVAKRCYRFAHGVGRSGDVAEVQPKAAGSSLMNKLAHLLLMHALQLTGLTNAKGCLALPMATGMSVALVLLTLKLDKPAAKYVVWPRMDQKSCFKAILTAGLIPVIVKNRQDGDAVALDVEEMERIIGSLPPESVLCVLTTTSCFAPRLPDAVDKVAKLCQALSVPHVINNAYGLQCRRTMKLVNRAMQVGRVDVVVQSMDKNFMVPVGGAVLCGPDDALLAKVGRAYAGRASSAPVLDLFITLLAMGEEGFVRLLDEREAMIPYFVDKLQGVAERHGERLLQSPGNSISFAMSLESEAFAPGGEATKFLGSALWLRMVSGTRVVCPEHKAIQGHDFQGYGASIDSYPCSYLTAACAIGQTKGEVDELALRLDKLLTEREKRPPPPDRTI